MLLLRRAILLQLEAAQPASVPPETLLDGLILAGHPSLSRDKLTPELHYLRDKGLLHEQPATLDPSKLRYRLTPAGRDYLATEGLA
ncbi:MAG: winged helix-turn-helix transcriptional regulator [Opitutales bacterium]